jgi:hypothetical protein
VAQSHEPIRLEAHSSEQASEVERLPCYLETSTEKNVAFYSKRGFAVVNEGVVPGSDLHVWAMMRHQQKLSRA